MADENLREDAEIQSANQAEKQSESNSEKSRRSWFSRRNLLILVALPVVLIAVAALILFVAVRSGYVAKRIETAFVAQMDKFGVKTEIGSFEQTFSPLGTILRDVKFYDKETNELLAKVNVIQLDATVTDLLAPNLTRTIRLDSTTVEGLEAWVKFDAEGRSNFSRLKVPEQEESNLRFDFNTMKFLLKDSIVHYGDDSRKLSGAANNVRLFIEPDAGLSKSEAEIENRRFKFDLSATNSNFTVDDKPIDPIDVSVKGVATESYAEISELNLKTPFTESRLTGRIENWEKLKYSLKVVSSVDLQKTAETFKTVQTLRGIGNFDGTIEGEGLEKYSVNGEIQSDALAADNVRLQGLRVNASVSGSENAYEANGKAIAEMLTYEDFRLDAVQFGGQVRGTGTDFRWLGELRAAAAKFPGGRIANLILADAVAEYRDKQLTAEFGSASVASLDAFDAKVRAARASGVKIRSANGATDATIGNVRADSVNSRAGNLRGVNASNVRVRDRAGAGTNVEVGSLQAQNLEAQGAKIQGLNAGNVSANLRGNSISARAGNVSASNVTATGANVKDLRASGVDIENRGNSTDVFVKNAAVGGVTSDAVVLGSLNVAGVRLKILGGRVEGSSGDINAGNVTILRTRDLPQGGKIENVRAFRPVFVLEPSGRYRASADLSLGGGVLGSLRVGKARAALTATNGQVELQNLNAEIIEGNVNGAATIVYAGRANSRVNANFDNLDVAKLLALTGGQVVPLAGKTNGNVDLTFPGLNYRVATGVLNADIAAEAGSDENRRVPVNGKLAVRATNGLFDIETANFKTASSEFNADGRFDLNGDDSNLNVKLNSSDAKELQEIISVLNVAPDLDRQLAQNNIEIGGEFDFTGNITGSLNFPFGKPIVKGRARLESISANNRFLGELKTDINLNGGTIRLDNGLLNQADGGNVKFDLIVPNGDSNNIAVNAVLDNVDVGNLLAALPIQDSLPDALKNTSAKASGAIALTGVPSNINGTAEIASNGGSIGGESFDRLDARVRFENSNILIERLNARAGEGTLAVNGNYDRAKSEFNLTARGENLPVERLRGFAGTDAPNAAGIVNFTANGKGVLAYTPKGELDFSGVDVNFQGTGSQITVDNRAVGEITFNGETKNSQLTANVTADINGQKQTIAANLNFADKTLPFRAETVFNDTDLAPFAAIFQDPESVALGGRATGRATFGGNLRQRNAAGELVFSTDNLTGEASFTNLALQVEDVVLTAAEPFTVKLSAAAADFQKARFVGSGSDITLDGRLVYAGAGESNLSINGAVNLRILNALSNNQFFGGLANVSVTLAGASGNTNISGAVNFDNSTFTAIISNERTTFTNIVGRIIFNQNRAQIANLEARLGGGIIKASGGIVFDNLEIESYRLEMRGDDISARLPRDFRTTGDAVVQISGARVKKAVTTKTGTIPAVYNSLISGEIFATRAVYSRNIELIDLVSSRRTGSISTGTGDPALGVPQLDLRIVGRDALIVQNETADLTGSLDIRVTGDVNEPIISGRVTATGGTIVLLNGTRYDITRATVDLPASADASPVINFQGEADIAGFQVVLQASGEINDTNNLNITLRSNPALPQADVVSLVTTGSLTGAGDGIPTLAQTGLNTAADLVTDALINQPIRKATDRLFGLNRFELSPVLAGQRGINPGARLSVGRQINRNLSVIYSTNLSQDRNQVLALEYRVSNKVSFVAQYEQAPLSNVTRRPDNFSFEVRFRRRF